MSVFAQPQYGASDVDHVVPVARCAVDEQELARRERLRDADARAWVCFVARRRAERWLIEQLTGQGEVDVGELQHRATAARIEWHAVRRAAMHLGVQRLTARGRATWGLNDSPEKNDQKTG
jgi:hypothetical protein